MEELKVAFDVFDKDGDGNITSNELSSIMKGLGESLSEKEIKSMINEVDEDNNGTIDFNEFKKLMLNDYGNTDAFTFNIHANKKLNKIVDDPNENDPLDDINTDDDFNDNNNISNNNNDINNGNHKKKHKKKQHNIKYDQI